MTILELMTALVSAKSLAEGAQIATDSNIAGAKEVYMAWGKEKGSTAKELEQFWKLCQPAKTTSGKFGFAEMFYDWLAEASRTEQEAHDLIMGNESNNVRNHLTHYLNIWALAESVRAGQKVVRTITGKSTPKPQGSKQSADKAEQADTWEYNDASPFEDVRSAYENLKRETAKPKPRKTRIHPDKVAHLNDAKLTEAYNQAFKVFGK